MEMLKWNGHGGLGKRDGSKSIMCHTAARGPSEDPYNLAGLQALCRNCHFEKTAGENRRPDPDREALIARLSRY